MPILARNSANLPLAVPYEKPPAEEMKSTLQFLGNGRRGFLLVMKDGPENAVVKPGDKVFVER